MVTSNDRATLLLRLIAEATRNDLLNVETVMHALDTQLSIPDLIYVRMASETITACYLKLLTEKGGYGSQGTSQEDGATSTIRGM
jgi:hypothetical protein